MASSRIQYLDIAKGILIILLVFAHFRSAVIRIPYESPYFELMYGWNHVFTCFYMPAFFIISGYCSNLKQPFGTFLISIVKTLLIPIIAFTLIDQAVISYLNKTNYLEDLWLHFIKVDVLWFLQAMIIAKLILYCIRRVNGLWGGYILICLILLCLGVFLNQWNKESNPFFYKHALIASFWIAVGQWLRENNTVYEKFLKWSLYVYPLIAIATFVISSSFTAIISISLKTIPFHILYSLVGSMFLLKICSFIKENSILEYWGKNSITVYALHFTPLLFMTQTLWEWLHPDALWMFILYFILLYIIEYTICWLLMKLFSVKPFNYALGKF